ncbi:FtsW/RodA/SpoVE family cell cycle protein [Patescibacteria group bacterium]
MAKILLPVIFLICLSIAVLTVISPTLFPLYFIYILFAIAAFFVFSKIDFEVLSLFSNHFYVISILLLIVTLFIGQVTRGTIRWIPIGAFTLQPTEIVRPFLLVFFANYLTSEKLKLSRLAKAFLLLALPIVLIFVQPSLGVTILTIIGFLGVLLSTGFKKRYIFLGLFVLVAVTPLFWRVLAPYQKQRITSFVNPQSDPLGSGYNSIQAMISVGEGRLFGLGLGKGVQTQLAFLPERHSDFIFASVSEELGFLGAGLVLLAVFLILFQIIKLMENASSPAARAYLSGLFAVIFAEVFIHVGMNLGLLPITGLPFPLLSAGGSSLLATMMGLGIALAARHR